MQKCMIFIGNVFLSAYLTVQVVATSLNLFNNLMIVCVCVFLIFSSGNCDILWNYQQTFMNVASCCLYPPVQPSVCHKGKLAESFDTEKISLLQNQTNSNVCSNCLPRAFPFHQNLYFHNQGFSLQSQWIKERRKVFTVKMAI